MEKGVNYSGPCGGGEKCLEVDLQMCVCWVHVYAHRNTHAHEHTISSGLECASVIHTPVKESRTL